MLSGMLVVCMCGLIEGRRRTAAQREGRGKLHGCSMRWCVAVRLAGLAMGESFQGEVLGMHAAWLEDTASTQHNNYQD